MRGLSSVFFLRALLITLVVISFQNCGPAAHLGAGIGNGEPYEGMTAGLPVTSMPYGNQISDTRDVFVCLATDGGQPVSILKGQMRGDQRLLQFNDESFAVSRFDFEMNFTELSLQGGAYLLKSLIFSPDRSQAHLTLFTSNAEANSVLVIPMRCQ
jgi:hypothetical protein